ncbi:MULTISPECIES: class I SAM-dependent methyltransferase [unclassified Rathayibacter]|uniref:class I SAM-dependent methyltransferase n=1 Tax=unclassified Rathayibacter TaxID=2609250 RepID=UPI00188D9AFC|nr:MULTISPECIES: class I SAM-dependent methyltransferase [unclassified Rathayibacter]MBF4461641.1 class I SAM-dependent methyltransferase [Rathayibacter sp. VKM Ac-2879]MBF4503052.1 class I SAM-dependent methyltransferase [Rathayibacter sp. VKM Ac-2878]
MHRDELVELLSPEGLRLLDSLDGYRSDDLVRAVARLRSAGHSPTLVAAVLTQARLRTKAETKFGEFARSMLFTDAGLEQATRLRVAALHAGRFAAAGASRVADLGSGIGGDALAMAAIDLAVTAVDSDEVTATLASFNLAPFPSAQAVHGDATSFDLDGYDAVYLDPARRTSGHRETRRLDDPDDYSPSLDFAFGLARDRPVGVKLGPGFDRDRLPPDAEAQWVSVDGELVETGLWFGALAREGVRRSALLLGAGRTVELTAAADSDDEEVGELGAFVHEPDGSAIRARLLGELARTSGSRMLSSGIAYLTGDEPASSPFLRSFRVLAELPLDERTLAKELRARGIGVLEIKKRGVDVDPARFRRKLGLSGRGSAVLILTRIRGRHRALLAERHD